MPRQQALASEGGGTPRARNPGRTRPTARDTRQSHPSLSRSLSERPRREGDATVARENTRRLPERETPVNNDTRPRAVEMHPAWMDSERGSENAKSEPQKIPRPSPPARAPPTDGSCSEASSAYPPRRVLAHENVRLLRPHAVRGGEEEAHDHWHDKWEAPTNLPRGEYPRARRHRRRRRGGRRRAPGQARRLAAPGDVYKLASTPPSPAHPPRASTRPKRAKTVAVREDIYKSTFWG